MTAKYILAKQDVLNTGETVYRVWDSSKSVHAGCWFAIAGERLRNRNPRGPHHIVYYEHPEAEHG